MTGVLFECGHKCDSGYYLFTRWEPDCHQCPAEGAECSGDYANISYAYYAKVKQTNLTEDNPQDIVCSIKFYTYLCPSELCCTDINNGCKFEGNNTEILCADNRDPDVNFCGECLEGYSEVYGDAGCKLG